MILTGALIFVIYKIIMLESKISIQQAKIDRYELNDAYRAKIKEKFRKEYEQSLKENKDER
jgi:hypothetical protein